jgi:gamma-glutamylcyclotransferase
MNTLSYFAYGSNMSSKRLQARTPSARVIGTGILRGHRLVFHKQSTIDGSGKCDVIKSRSDQVCGVLYKIDKTEKTILDHLEGLGLGYDEKSVPIFLSSGDCVSAVTYFATNIRSSLKPFSWYLNHVLTGAREARLPSVYVKSLEETKATEDPDRERWAREIAIYQ